MTPRALAAPSPWITRQAVIEAVGDDAAVVDVEAIADRLGLTEEANDG